MNSLISGFLLMFCVLPVLAQAQQPEIRVGLSQNVAPKKQGNTIQFESELIRQLLAELGYKAVFIAAPHVRLSRMLQDKELDMAARQGGEQIEGLFYSPAYIEFHNLVFALADFPDQLETVKDMGRYSVASFQYATRILGPEFSQAMAISPSFREVVDHNQALICCSNKELNCWCWMQSAFTGAGPKEVCQNIRFVASIFFQNLNTKLVSQTKSYSGKSASYYKDGWTQAGSHSCKNKPGN